MFRADPGSAVTSSSSNGAQLDEGPIRCLFRRRPCRFLGLSGSAFAAAPPSDAFASAETLAFKTLIDGTTAQATTEGGEGAHGGVAASHSVWYGFTAAHSGHADITVYSGHFTPVATLYSGTTLGNLKKVADSEDFATEEGEFENTGGEIENQKYFDMAFDVVAGTKYWLALDTGNPPATGAFEICAGEPFAATNDDFADAERLTAETNQAGTTNDTTDEPGEGSRGGVAPSHSVWFTYTAAETGRTLLNVTSGDFRPVATVYTGTSLGGPGHRRRQQRIHPVQPGLRRRRHRTRL